MPLCDRCLKRNKGKTAIGYIPLPDRITEQRSAANEANRINVCQFHYEQAVELCYYVLLNDKRDDSPSSSFEHRTWEKHIKLRGSRDLKYDPFYAGLRVA